MRLYVFPFVEPGSTQCAPSPFSLGGRGGEPPTKFSKFLTKNLNWEILTKNLVTFKRWDGFKDEKF